MNRIKEFRQEARLKQKDLADMLSVKQGTVKRMADIFNCSIDELLGQKEKPVVKDDRLNRKLELLNDENLQRMEDYVDLLLKTQGE